jgi:hypothetical protein
MHDTRELRGEREIDRDRDRERTERGENEDVIADRDDFDIHHAVNLPPRLLFN